ncbi:uncharacterized protein N7479_006455 [Penicillium vulpinum]|uniref:Uncharacterized protein n=1 Tax=Penicillium vulpinum TaxID=29845 RepID=A0A1V6S348_9EURO|nr:uncharacterized protein N7479_006455 [Penicillium vulpinum]KAJ5959305.1 hypothetical protein N7479_006455 [Penicillium vulpinum]OQE08063.1 hypothetical protein PENVUL_c011G02406 [Penicillium vulpinum]
MASNTSPPTPTQCPEPSEFCEEWLAALIGGVCGLVGLVIISLFLLWLVRFNAQQALMNHPQRLISHEYLQLKKEIAEAEEDL